MNSTPYIKFKKSKKTKKNQPKQNPETGCRGTRITCPPQNIFQTWYFREEETPHLFTKDCWDGCLCSFRDPSSAGRAGGNAFWGWEISPVQVLFPTMQPPEGWLWEQNLERTLSMFMFYLSSLNCDKWLQHNSADLKPWTKWENPHFTCPANIFQACA